jgi:regulator of chromosome condensation
LKQYKPTKLPELQNIKRLVSGVNHVLALDINGVIWGWGAEDKCQLGRKPVARMGEKKENLIPHRLEGFKKAKKIADIASGEDHSFAIGVDGKVWSWGYNGNGQTGHRDGVGNDINPTKESRLDSVIIGPRLVKSLSAYKIVEFAAGKSHTLARTDEGELLVWGRCDSCIAGLDMSLVPEENYETDNRGEPSAILIPTKITIGQDGFQPSAHVIGHLKDVKLKTPITAIGAGPDHSFAITADGKAFSWGFNNENQCGVGDTKGKDVPKPTMIRNSATKSKKLNWASGGAGYSVITGIPGARRDVSPQPEDDEEAREDCKVCFPDSDDED